jgi:hypothetical protein
MVQGLAARDLPIGVGDVALEVVLEGQDQRDRRLSVAAGRGRVLGGRDEDGQLRPAWVQTQGIPRAQGTSELLAALG